MELLIPGLILVALMVYASTRLKKYTASAFEKENIETDEFSLIKPDGFLHNLNGNPSLAFEAYSKEFGENATANTRQATIELSLLKSRSFDDVVETAKTSGSVAAEKSFVRDEMHSASIEIERGQFIDHYLIVDAPRGIYELRSTALRDYDDALSGKIEELEESFSIKK